jgi:hypothetical protein
MTTTLTTQGWVSDDQTTGVWTPNADSVTDLNGGIVNLGNTVNTLAGSDSITGAGGVMAMTLSLERVRVSAFSTAVARLIPELAMTLSLEQARLTAFSTVVARLIPELAMTRLRAVPLGLVAGLFKTQVASSPVMGMIPLRAVAAEILVSASSTLAAPPSSILEMGMM